MASRPDTSGRYTPGNEAARLREAARVFYPENFPGECVVAILGVSPGYSGSAFARVEASGRSWCLRGWPLGFGGERLRFVHRALLEIRRAAFTACRTWRAPLQGRPWRRSPGACTTPRSGWPEDRSPPGRITGGQASRCPTWWCVRRRGAQARALARLHCCGARLAGRTRQEPDHLSRRLDALTVETAEHVGPLMRAVLARDAGEESEVAWRWLELLPGALAAAREASEALPDEGGGTRVVCHGGLWPAHAWFDGEAFVGFTDLESLTFASPALNLAQLVTHFPGWGAEKRSSVSTNHLPTQGKGPGGLIEAVADPAGEGLWSLSSLYGESLSRASPAQGAAHRANLRSLLVSLAQATGDVKRSRI